MIVGGGEAFTRGVLHSISALSGDVVYLLAPLLAVTAIGRLVGEALRGFHDVRGATLVADAGPPMLTAGAFVLLWAGGTTIGLRGVLLVVLLVTTATAAFGIALLASRSLACSRRRGGEALVGQRLACRWHDHAGRPSLAGSCSDRSADPREFPTSRGCRADAAAEKLSLLLVLLLVAVNSIVPSFVVALHSMRAQARLEHLLRMTATAAFIPTAIATLVLVAFSGVDPSDRVRATLPGWLDDPQNPGSRGRGLRSDGMMRLGAVPDWSSAACGADRGINRRSNSRHGGRECTSLRCSRPGCGNFTGTAAQNLGLLAGARVKCGVWTYPYLRPMGIRRALSDMRGLLGPISGQ